MITIERGRPGIIMLAQEMQALGLRCTCSMCLRLDARYPGEGYQLALFRDLPERNQPVKMRMKS